MVFLYFGVALCKLQCSAAMERSAVLMAMWERRRLFEPVSYSSVPEILGRIPVTRHEVDWLGHVSRTKMINVTPICT
jgi:hypothetical protein